MPFQMMKINADSKKMDDSDTFVKTWRSLMEENYLKEAEPHAGAYFLRHMSEEWYWKILVLYHLTADRFIQRNRIVNFA